MITQQIELPGKFANLLITFPENGMGYQVVKVFNSSVLIVDQNLKLNKHNIEKFELE